VKAFGLFTFLFLACGTANSQGLRVLPVQVRGGQEFPAAIQFFCTENYRRKDCKNDIFILSQALAHYPLDKLGSWSFILASSDEWEPLMSRLRLPADSPAFSMLGGNTTVFSQVLYSAPADQRAELMKAFGVPLNQLLELAVAHELEHALCHELSEAKAFSYGEQLRAGHQIGCTVSEGHRAIAGGKSSIAAFVTKLCLPAPKRKPGVAGNLEQSVPEHKGTY
jgi:hypothetical protein